MVGSVFVRLTCACACLLSAVAVVPSGAAAKQVADLPVLRCYSDDLGSFFRDAYTTLERDEVIFPASSSTKLNAISTNGGMGAGVLRDGTVASLRWPTVLSYQQLRYVSKGPKKPKNGVRADNGMVLGLVIGARTVWLRDFPSMRQRYVSDTSDEIETIFTDPTLGLTVTLRQVVRPDMDAFLQRVTVTRAPGGATPTSLMAYENISANNLIIPSALAPDGCADEFSTDSVRYDPSGAIVHWRYTKAFHTGKQDNIALAFAATEVDQWQVGLDADSRPLLRPAGWRDAYVDSLDGTLSGNRIGLGQTNGALRAPLRFSGDEAVMEVAVAGARRAGEAVTLAREALRRGQQEAASAKAAMYDQRLAKAPMPDTDDAGVLRLARRSLITLISYVSPTGAQTGGIANQPHYSFDWPRTGMYADIALDMAGMHDLSRKHKEFYIRTQRRPGYRPIGDMGTPFGSWPMNMYEDGTSGGPLPYEIDETGMVAWGYWDHYLQTRDRDYLQRVWPSLRLAAEHFLKCRDPYTNLQCKQYEGDQAPKAVSIAGAMPAMQAVTAAREAAKVLGLPAEVERFSQREVELRAAFEKYLWNEKAGRYEQAPLQRRRGDTAVKPANIYMASAYLGWPLEFNPISNERMRRHYDGLWKLMEPSFEAPNAGRKAAFYDQLGLLTLARVWKGDAQRMANVKRGLSWLANTVATADTATLGEAWIVRDGKVIPVTATPHKWGHVLYYLASVEAWGPKLPQ